MVRSHDAAWLAWVSQLLRWRQPRSQLRRAISAQIHQWTWIQVEPRLIRSVLPLHTSRDPPGQKVPSFCPLLRRIGIACLLPLNTSFRLAEFSFLGVYSQVQIQILLHQHNHCKALSNLHAQAGSSTKECSCSTTTPEVCAQRSPQSI